MTEKLQKVLATLGLGSRREIERWIADGRVEINGRRAELGERVDEKARLKIDGKIVRRPHVLQRPRTRVLIYHKVDGEVCTRSDPEGRPTVFSRIPSLINQRWVMIGRLDINTLGLLLFTNNGELAHRLLHPSYEIEREYAVRVMGKVSADSLERLRQGVELDDGFARFTSIKAVGGAGINQWYHVIIKEGRQREVRRLWESQEVKVSRLIRVRFGSITLPAHLSRGCWEELDPAGVQSLFTSVNVSQDVGT